LVADVAITALGVMRLGNIHDTKPTDLRAVKQRAERRDCPTG
jgi:hypothetical protein